MSRSSWRTEVALLLERSAALIRTHQDRQLAATLGTAIGYLLRAEDSGDRSATVILAQLQNLRRGEDNTKRFSFAPGELEELTGQSQSK